MSPRMPDHRSPSSVGTMAFIGRSVLSFRRNQVVSMDQYHEDELQDLDLFQSYVAERLLSLTENPTFDHDRHNILSFSFLQRVLDVFVSCEDEFKNLLASNPGLVAKPPADRLLSDLLDRAVKSLDICNSVRQSLQCLRHWNRNADIAASAILTHPSEGHLRRTKKALDSLLLSAESSQIQEASAARKPERAWSFRCKANASAREEMLKSWSASKQVQAMSAGLTAPRIGDVGCGFALAAYAMCSVLVFAMWAVVAAFPGTERGGNLLPVPVVQPPKQLAWAGAMVSLQERIVEEWRRRGKREGMLTEMLAVEKCGKELMDLIGGGEAEEIVEKAAVLATASRGLEEGLEPFERRVREVFRRVVDSRAEVMKLLDQSTRSSPPFIVL